MSAEMKALVLLLANAVTEILDRDGDKKGGDNVSAEIKKLVGIIRERGG